MPATGTEVKPWIWKDAFKIIKSGNMNGLEKKTIRCMLSEFRGYKHEEQWVEGNDCSCAAVTEIFGVEGEVWGRADIA